MLFQYKGFEVVLVGRSPEKTKRIADELKAKFYLADFTKLADVRKLAAQIKQDYPRIDVLLNNAGGVFGNRELTVDGHEKTLQVNHLAHFLLTNLLMDTLINSKATVINISSIANERYGNIDIKKLDLEHGFTPNRAYGNAKLANILFTKELHRRYHAIGISTVAVHPGNIATNFASDTTSLILKPWALSRTSAALGGLMTDVKDLLQYTRFQMGDGSWQTPGGETVQLLKPETMQLMQSKQAPGASKNEAVGIA